MTSNQEAVARIASGLSRSQAAQKQAREARREAELATEPETEDQRLDRLIARADSDPEFERSLTPQMKMTLGYRRRAILRAELLLGIKPNQSEQENQ